MTSDIHVVGPIADPILKYIVDPIIDYFIAPVFKAIGFVIKYAFFALLIYVGLRMFFGALFGALQAIQPPY